MSVLSVKVSEPIPEHHPLDFSKLSKYHYISHEIVFDALYNGTVIICRKQVDDDPVLLSRYFEVPVYSDTFTKNAGMKVSRYNRAYDHK